MTEIKPIIENSTLLYLDLEVARVFGTNEAIFLSRLHFWIEKMKGNDQGRYAKGFQWISNPADSKYEGKNKWVEQLPWSSKTILRIIKRLELAGVIIRDNNLNFNKKDHSTWCRIDYEKLTELVKAGNPLKFPGVYRYKKEKDNLIMTSGQNQKMTDGQNPYSNNMLSSNEHQEKKNKHDNNSHRGTNTSNLIYKTNNFKSVTDNKLPVTDNKQYTSEAARLAYGDLGQVIEIVAEGDLDDISPIGGE